MDIIKGKPIADQIKGKVQKAVEELKAQGKRLPGLAVVRMNDDPASATYVRNIIKAGENVGFVCTLHQLDLDLSQDQVIAEIEKLNQDERVDGIILQMPMPKHINVKTVTETIAFAKDVEGVTVVNAGKLFVGDKGFVPCTPQAVMEILHAMDLSLEGKHAVVIGRSNVVGKPVSILLQKDNCTVTMCHSRSKDLPGLARQADILVCAVGKAKMVDATYTNPDQVIIDVAINLDENGKLCGDVDFADVEGKVQAITPVPGGVGTVTNAVLLQSTLAAYQEHAIQ
ncbi:MAG: bifunctional 5,10-methylenetetrahydrofolate dehydrogenase/5,10-methenyltetrahydrofolate cyclohydrolase [Eubacteriales bacterium]|nr:bifunctional 5,10-methylenetetrahydrofolate dehydrogenase/5,10-methenyltetrahydrofolate cyclohydrolase [Clostridiales bacterium]MDY5836168.1 bifunctional 5,10-methylenetetrahydrofolate dehydrogenase/5,10-methenyltetrahydrofolate cyclohydrolase [Eubacteriales bacterium]